MHLEITTRIFCRLQCSFCPQKTLVKAYSGDAVLTLDNFHKILQKTPKDVEIHFSGYAEPFLNENAPQMVLDAKKAGFPVHIYSTLTGLTESGAQLLKEAQPNFIKIHVADTVGMIIPDEKWIKTHEIFLTTGLGAYYMAMGPLTPGVEFYLQSKGINYEKPKMLSRAGLIPVSNINIKGRLVCSMNRWHQNVILPNGDVYVCCMDYGLTMPMGNLFNQNYSELYEKAESYRKRITNDSICRKCEWAVACS